MQAFRPGLFPGAPSFRQSHRERVGDHESQLTHSRENHFRHVRTRAHTKRPGANADGRRIRANFAAAVRTFARPLDSEQTIVCLRSSFARSTSASAKTFASSTWPANPRSLTAALANLPASCTWPSSLRCLNGARQAFITIRRSRSVPTEPSPASIARCTSRRIRSTTRSFISRPAISAFKAVDTHLGRVGTLVCWDQWYPEGRAPYSAARRRSAVFYPPQSAGIRRRKRVRSSAI